MNKSLSLIHLEVGQKLSSEIDSDPFLQAKLVAVYLAPVDVLKKYKTDPSVLEGLVSQAEEMDAIEAAQIISDFFSSLKDYAAKIQNFSKVAKEVKK